MAPTPPGAPAAGEADKDAAEGTGRGGGRAPNVPMPSPVPGCGVVLGAGVRAPTREADQHAGGDSPLALSLAVRVAARMRTRSPGALAKLDGGIWWRSLEPMVQKEAV